MKLEITICDGCGLTNHKEPTVENRGNGKDYCADCWAKSATLAKAADEAMRLARMKQWAAGEPRFPNAPMQSG